MKNFAVLGGKKTKPIYLAPSIAGGRKTYLKKQSQFAGGQIGASSYSKGYYD
jgi:hypothetical protein